MNQRETKATIKNFTPLLDELVRNHGVVTAAVWGRVWRYAQQENGVCQASQEKIAFELRLSRRTVIRHLQILSDEGYLKDNTPNLRNKPHTYSITSKARILITVEGVTESHSNDQDGVTESHSAVTLSHTHGDRESHEETKKKQIKKQNNTAIPESLNTPDFLVAWSDWITYRKEKKQQVTPSTATRQLKKLAAYPVTVAIGMIEQSIEKGWQGLFELKDGISLSSTIVVNNDGSFNV